MKFIIGFLSGMVVGAAGAVAYSVQTGRDLREVADEIRSDLSKRDLDALGARLEGSVSDLQNQLSGLIAAVNDRATAVTDRTDGIGSAGDAIDGAVDAADEVADAAEGARKD